MSSRKTVLLSRVYFAQEDGRGLIKIGQSKNVKQRVGVLSSAGPYAVNRLGDMPGGPCAEDYCHAYFTPQRMRGEWFESSPFLLETAEAGTLPLPDDRVALVNNWSPTVRQEVPLADMYEWARIEQALCEGHSEIEHIAFYTDTEEDTVAERLRAMQGAYYLHGCAQPKLRREPVATIS